MASLSTFDEGGFHWPLIYHRRRLRVDRLELHQDGFCHPSQTAIVPPCVTVFSSKGTLLCKYPWTASQNVFQSHLTLFTKTTNDSSHLLPAAEIVRSGEGLQLCIQNKLCQLFRVAINELPPSQVSRAVSPVLLTFLCRAPVRRGGRALRGRGGACEGAEGGGEGM